MKQNFKPSGKSLFLLLFVLLITPVITNAQGFSTQTQNKLKHIIDSFQTDPANPYVGGMAAAIKVDGLAYWDGATGYAARNIDGNNQLLPGGTAFTTSTLSRMYSVTKTFTASLVLELAQGGAFNLDDPVNKFIPLNLINPGLNGSVTIRQLLAHESGYSNYTDEQMLLIAVAFQPTHVWTVFEMLSFVHQINAPGAVRQYSSTNYLTLGAIIEMVTGKPVEQHFRERFFTPLKLNSIYLGVRESQPAGTLLASPHDNISAFNPVFQLTGQPVFPDAYTNISAFPFTSIVSLAFTGGGLVTNVADMADWGNALFTGRATSKSTIDMMMNSISPTPDDGGDFLGYGIWRTTKISKTDVFIGHDGNAPGYRSVMFYQPERKMTIAILTNYHGAKLYDVAKALYEALPDFICGNKNKKENKILLTYNGNSLCVDRNAAAGFIEKGAFLGSETAIAPLASLEKSLNDLKNEYQFTVSSEQFTTYPNPAKGKINISFTATQSGQHSLVIYELSGKYVTQLYDGVVQKNITQKISWNTNSNMAGTYIAWLKTPKGNQIKKIFITTQSY